MLKQNRTFIIADTHFGHENIIKYCQRPFTNVEQMDRVMIHNWNEVVSDNDLVYHLGDFALANGNRVIELIERLNGEIILIRGNHDRSGTARFLSYGFKEVHKRLDIGKYILTHVPLPILPEGKVNIHGHVHGGIRSDAIGYICCSVEIIGYRPTLFDFSAAEETR